MEALYEMRGNDFHYTVKGGWPFPQDMLRRDMAVPASEEDRSAIELLSLPFAPDRSAIRIRRTINLVIPNAKSWRPNTPRWRSFRWDVPADAESLMLKEEAARRRKMERHYRSAMAKLTVEEREAIDWFRPAFRA